MRGRAFALLPFLFLVLAAWCVPPSSDAMPAVITSDHPGGRPVTSQDPANFTVFDARGIAMNAATRYLLASIEGIVNKDRADLFVIQDENDAFWLDYINASGHLVGHLHPFTSVIDVVAFFKDRFEGIAIFNSSDPETANMVTPLCGVNRSLLVAQDLHAAVTAIHPWPVTWNATTMVAEHGLVTRLSKYQHVYEHHFHLCNQSALGLFPATAPLHMRGFLIQNNIFPIWRILFVPSAEEEGGGPARQPDPPEEIAFFERVLDETAVNIPVFGYPYADGNNEGITVTTISRRGKYLIPCDWFHNLPFHARTTLPQGYEFRQMRAATPPPLENKVYATALWSDGDNIQYVSSFMRTVLWDNREPGDVPVGWTISSSISWLAPWMARYYYDNAASTDYFVSALSGKGYMYPREMNRTMLEAYYTDANDLNARMDLTEIWTMHLGDAKHDVTSLLDPSITALFDGYGTVSKRPEKVNTIPIVYSKFVDDDVEAAVSYFRNIKPSPVSDPVFVFVLLHNWKGGNNPGFWNDIAREIRASGTVVLRPDEFSALLNQAQLGAVDLASFLHQAFLLPLAVALAGLAAASRTRGGPRSRPRP